MSHIAVLGSQIGWQAPSCGVIRHPAHAVEWCSLPALSTFYLTQSILLVARQHFSLDSVRGGSDHLDGVDHAVSPPEYFEYVLEGFGRIGASANHRS